MLKRIKCDKFAPSYQDITLDDGLNIILGDDAGSSAIGKTAFLNVIDYVFGGDAYYSGDIQKNVGLHSICFEFEFGDEHLYFCRETGNTLSVFLCDDQWHYREEIELPQYRRMLAEKYGCLSGHFDLPDIMAHFFRIYGHGNALETAPYRSSIHEDEKKAIGFLMNVFGYARVNASIIVKAKELGVRLSQLKKKTDSQDTQDEQTLESNLQKIESLTERYNELMSDSEEYQFGYLGFSASKTDPVAEKLNRLRDEVRKLTITRDGFQAQIDAIKGVQDTDIATLTTEFAGLKRFFPNANIAVLTDIENFHKRIHEIVQKIEPSHIEDSHDVKVVFFKQNLSTGWDCPRAETMMSFRSATDYTYIAQLLGRMIRTPLARRIMEDAELNNVSLFLPFYNAETVKHVIDALRNSEAVLPTDTGSSSEMIVLRRNPQYADVFGAIDRMQLVTTVVESAHKMNPIKAYMQMARNLTMDDVDHHALKKARYALLDKMDAEITRIKTSGSYDERASRVTGFPMGAAIYDYGESTVSFDDETQEMTVIEFDVRQHFELAGKILSEGLHKDYWRRHFSDQSDVAIQTEVMVLVEDATAMDAIVSFAEAQFHSLYNQYKFDIRGLTEKRKEAYGRLINSASLATEVPWELPQTIDFNTSDSSTYFDKHLYIDESGSFRATLNNWETGVLAEELDKTDVVCWMRNLDRKKWSLAIPYEVSGAQVPMYPDLIIVRAISTGYVVDILEPHDPSRKDNYPKAVGLAKFASKHWDKFGRIQLIRKMSGLDGNEHFYRLDMSDLQVCQRVLSITSNQELDHIFDDAATRDE